MFIREVLLPIITIIFTQNIEVKVLSFLSSDVRNNTGVAAPVSHRSMHQTQTAAACGLNRYIVSVYLWSAWNVFTGNVGIGIILPFQAGKTYQWQ